MAESTTRSTTPTALLEGASGSRLLGIVLTFAFVALIAAPGSCQVWAQPELQEQRLRELFQTFPEPPSPGTLSNYADALAADSEVGALLRRRYQLLLTVGLHEGSAKVAVAHDGFLFWRGDAILSTGTTIFQERPDVYRTHPEPTQWKASPEETASLAAIIAFRDQIKDYGIHLVVVPMPLGPTIYPEEIWPAYPKEAGPAWGPDFPRWLNRLAEAGVDVVDVTDVLWKAKATGESPWIKHNTHWSPRGVAISAAKIAEHVRPWLGDYAPERYVGRSRRKLVASDLAPALDLPAELYPPVTCDGTEVLQDDDIPRPGNDAPVLLVGDSFSRVYSGQQPGDTFRGADLGRQLMLCLGAPVQIMSWAGIDPNGMRDRLREYAGVLPGKKVLVWEFATRYLPDPGNWKSIALPPPRDRGRLPDE